MSGGFAGLGVFGNGEWLAPECQCCSDNLAVMPEQGILFAIGYVSASVPGARRSGCPFVKVVEVHRHGRKRVAQFTAPPSVPPPLPPPPLPLSPVLPLLANLPGLARSPLRAPMRTGREHRTRLGKQRSALAQTVALRLTAARACWTIGTTRWRRHVACKANECARNPEWVLMSWAAV